jgi:TonB family protein
MQKLMCGLALASLVVVAAHAQTQVYKPGNGVTAPRVLQKVRPVYPAAAERDRRAGTVVLDCVVGADGMVSEVAIVRATSEEFGDAAVAAAWQYRFSPGKKDGQPVLVRTQLEIVFTLR